MKRGIRKTGFPPRVSSKRRSRGCSCSPQQSNVKGKFGGKAAKLLKGAKKGVREVKV